MRLTLLEARQISRRPCLSAVSLRIHKDELAAILGPPGSGKSTLLRILSLQEEPDSGLLLWRGRLVTGPPSPDREALGRQAIHLVTGGDWPLAPPLTELLLVDDPPPGGMPRLLQLHRSGLTLLIATDDPETALWCETVYRLHKGGLEPLIRSF